ncbi:MAG TPA: chemotaxis protein CheW [Anaeromyxobacteraceae bacterium]|nr:chemotaxis protein CheW [Anaeromyxobacteraceae bacterium]
MADPAAEAGADPVRHVLFRAAGERFALPLASVREVVVPQPPFARVPRVSEAVRGVMNLRGRVLPVVDLAPLVGLPPQPLVGGQGQVLVLEREKRSLGLLIAQVIGVEPVGVPPPGADRVVRGVVVIKGAAVSVLAPDGLAEATDGLFGGGG